jgi:DNA-binding CsgD family transcriptional regulator
MAPVVVVVGRDGAVVSQNDRARRMMGEKLGGLCWDVVGTLEEAEGLPCEPGCVERLLSRGPDCTRRVDVRFAGRRHNLTCIPVDDTVVCLLDCVGEQEPKQSQLLTSRERDIVALLAAGLETGAVGKKLGVSESTVRSHVENMRTKLGVGTRAALVAVGFRLGYLS